MIRFIKALFWSNLSRPWFISKELRPYYERAKATEKRIKNNPMRHVRVPVKVKPWWRPYDPTDY